MGRFVASRLLEMTVVLIVMSFVIYALIGLMPGDPLDEMLMANPNMRPEDIVRMRAIYGLDQPIWTRYWHWLLSALQMDFGFSRVHSAPVMEILGPAIWHTIKLVLLALLISIIGALIFGIIAALRPRGAADALVNVIAFAGISVPSFWLALLLIMIFAVWLGWLPAGGMGEIGGDGGWGDLKYLLLPVVTLAFSQMGPLTRYVRSSMIETLRQDYIRTAMAKGVGPWRLIRAHALRNALIPVVTIIALSMGSLLSGALITETMFAQRGLGRTIYEAVMGNDFNLALMGLLFATFVTLICNLLADLAYAWLDPRISYG